MKGYIYLIENKINDKKYVGKTYLTIQKRWGEHCRDSKRFDRPLYRAIRKYGIENFSIKELEYCDNLEEREKYWISFYDSYYNGYNATLGGDGRSYFEYSDEEVITKYKELLSINKTADFFNCRVETIRARLINNNIPILKNGNIYSENRGQWQAKKVEQYSLEGEYIQSFPSLTAAALWLIDNNYTQAKVKHVSNNISKAAKGIEGRKKCYNFIWKYGE